jgi:hypothetical protein
MQPVKALAILSADQLDMCFAQCKSPLAFWGRFGAKRSPETVQDQFCSSPESVRNSLNATNLKLIFCVRTQVGN